MKKDDVSRRDFGKLALAAFGGVVAGSALGGSLLSADEKKEAAKGRARLLRPERLQGPGRGRQQRVRRQGKCSTTEAHGCHGANACKNQGGEGVNDCKGKGAARCPSRATPGRRPAPTTRPR